MENLFEHFGNIFKPENEFQKHHDHLDEQIQELEKLNKTNYKSYLFIEPKTEIEETKIYLN